MRGCRAFHTCGIGGIAQALEAVSGGVIAVGFTCRSTLLFRQSIQSVVVVIYWAEQAVFVAFDIAVGIEVIGALPGAYVLLCELIVLIVLTSELNAVTPKQRLEWPVRQITNVRGDAASGLTAKGEGNPNDLPSRITGIGASIPIKSAGPRAVAVKALALSR